MSTSGNGNFPFNDLPLELQCEIFLFAADVDGGQAVRLLLVARRIHTWLLPKFYEMVTLGSTDAALFLQTLESMPLDFFANHVKKLCLSISVSRKQAERILAVCTGVTDLAFWVDHIGKSTKPCIAPFIAPLRLRQLSIELVHFNSLFTNTFLQHAWCISLTHLDVIFWFHEVSPVIPHLDRLPSLTHLSLRLLHNQPREDSLRKILSTCAKLRILVIYHHTDLAEEMVWSTDPRVVYLPYPVHVIHEWEAQARLDKTCNWSRAEELVCRYITERERAASAQPTTQLSSK